MNDFERILINREYRGIKLGQFDSTIEQVLGKPDIYERQRKSYPAFFVYGPVEFRSRSGIVSYIGITFEEQEQLIPQCTTDLENGWPLNLDQATVILTAHNIKFEIDKIMSDDQQTVLITEDNVHLAFNDKNKLRKIAAAMP